jgi:hypothetical protein
MTDDSSMTMTNEQRQYHLAEYKSLKSEIAEAFKESFQVVVFSVTANAAIVTFVTSHSDLVGHGSFRFVSVIPLFVAVVSYALYLLRRRSINRIAKYLYKLEAVFSAKGLGWERFYASDIHARPWFVRTPAVLNTVMLVQIAYATIFAVLG